MTNRTVLISGGAIAGTTLAYWLARRGFAPTVVERAADLRSSGSPVDVRGPALDVVEQMGILSRLRDAATSATRLTFVNGNGRRVGGFNMGALALDRTPAEESSCHAQTSLRSSMRPDGPMPSTCSTTPSVPSTKTIVAWM